LQDLVLSASSPTRQIMPLSATKYARIGLVQRIKKGIGNCRMKEHSAAIEIFPQEYHTYIFRNLMESCGVTPYELISDARRIPTRRPEHPRNVDLKPNVTVLVELVHQASILLNAGQLPYRRLPVRNESKADYR